MYKVAILLSTFNGEKYIKELLESIKKQKKVTIKLFLIDDSSTDNTLNVVGKSGIDYEIVSRKGYKDPGINFFYLIKNVPKNFDYYCFCDQDDVWLKNKIIYSINRLKKENAEIIGSRTLYTNEKLIIYSKSILFKKKLSFRNSLVQSITGGNTQLWSNKLQILISKLEVSKPASHDWMMYQIASLLNLKFIFCERPLILYRQHNNNNIGANTGLYNMLKRIFWGIKGRYKKWHDLNENHLMDSLAKFDVSDENKYILKNFYRIRKSKNPIKKLFFIFFHLKIYRQTVKGNILLAFAILLDKI